MRKQIILIAVMLLGLIGMVSTLQMPVAAAQDPTIPTRTPTADGSALPAGTPVDEGVGTEIEPESVPTRVVPPTNPSRSGVLDLMVPLAGLALVGTGIVLALLSRNRRKQDGGQR